MAATLGMMGMEFRPRNRAMATTKDIPGLHLRLCPPLANPWHWVPAADSVPYLGLQLQPDREFSLQHKPGLCLAAVYHWCLKTLAPPKVVQDVILAYLGGGVIQYVATLIAEDSDTARHLDHVTTQVMNDRARYAFDATRNNLHNDRALGLTRVPTRCQQAGMAPLGTLVHHRAASVHAEATRMIWEVASGHPICPRCTTSSQNSHPWRGVTGSTVYPGPWLPWEWGSKTPFSAPRQPMSIHSPRRGTLLCCAQPGSGAGTHAASQCCT